MYKDLAEAIEDAKEKGYDKLFQIHNNSLTADGIDEEFTKDELTIVASHHFDRGTNPGDDRSLFLIETNSGVKGYLSTNYATYRNREKAEFLDKLINDQEDTV